MSEVADAVVIGSGPNGLVAANLLADAGWDVLVLEADEEPGGGVRSHQLMHPDFVSDHCSAFYPLAAASPVIRGLGLEDYGLRWLHAPTVLAHPLPDGRCAVLDRDPFKTATGLETFGAGDGDAWLRLWRLWEQLGDRLLDAVFTPFPPVRPGIALAVRLRLGGLLRFARFSLAPVRALSEHEFSGDGGPLLLTGSALHTDLSPESAGSSAYGWLLAMLGHQVGFPVPEGGAGKITGAMMARLSSRGGRVVCGTPASSIIVRGGRAVGVRTAAGEEVRARRAVIADIDAPQLYTSLLSEDDLPSSYPQDLARFQWDYATLKIDWAVRDGIPWTAAEAGRAGTIHLSGSLDEMTEYTSQIARRLVPTHPFILLGQLTTADPSRSPQGTQSVWAYTHLPREIRGDPLGQVSGRYDDADREALADRIEGEIERYAPGFRERIMSRRVMLPPALQEDDRAMPLGALNGGTCALHQQFVFRPTPGLGRSETPIAGLYLGSASAHPGGGVHGVCGANAARAALRDGHAVGRYIGAAVVALTRQSGASARVALHDGPKVLEHPAIAKDDQ